MGKEQINQTFEGKIRAKQNLFVPYIMAGDGGLDILEERISFLQDCGVAAIELGIPFSDPVADGPTIQAAGGRALENGTTLAGVLETLSSFKKTRTIPIILMTYVNPIYVYGVEKFAADCEKAGVAGVIIPDVPMEEETLVHHSLTKHSIAFIRLAALTSTAERIEELAKRSEGFLYAVAVAGTTGARATHEEDVMTYLQKLKKSSNVPVLAGFGVSTPEQAQALSSNCDGVIVGSTIVDLLHEGKNDEVRALIEGSL